MKTAIALGTFDGVHLGHRSIIDVAKTQAAQLGMEPMVYTFANHPMEVFGKRPPLLMEEDERLNRLECTDAALCADRFDAQLAATPPESFVDMLLSRFNMGCAVAGFNYTFGSKGLGNVELLKALAKTKGFEVVIVPPVLFEGEAVSSTRIRHCLALGDVARAQKMLLRPYSISGKIVYNKGIGKSLNYPTANIEGWEHRAIPAPGVYATLAKLGEKTMPAVTNIGDNPTVGGAKTTIETHILGFDGDIYGQTLTVKFIERLRGEIRFPNVEALAAQMKKDGENALKIIKNRR